MGFFRRLRQRLRRRDSIQNVEEDNQSSASASSLMQYSDSSTLELDPVPRATATATATSSALPRREQHVPSVKPKRYDEPLTREALEGIPELVHQLQTAPDTGCDQAARALRTLFALSEYGRSPEGGSSNKHKMEPVLPGALEEIRKDMISNGAGLVPVLLQFVDRCRHDIRTKTPKRSPTALKAIPKKSQTSSQLSLALLVLNNISIPMSSKRIVALECEGMKCLCRLLCDDPSCRIVVIVLVNLTFCDATLRRDLVYSHDIHLFPALSFACRVASMTLEEYNDRQHLWSPPHPPSPHSAATLSEPPERLQALLEWEESVGGGGGGDMKTTWPALTEQIFPDTARWCVCAMQNLTRSGPDGTANPAAFTLIHTGIVPYLLRCINIGQGAAAAAAAAANGGSPRVEVGHHGTDTSFSSSTGTGDSTPEPSDPEEGRRARHRPNDENRNHHPSKWVKETAQDAALYVILNLSTVPAARKFLLNNDNSDNMDTVSILATIAHQGRLSKSGLTADERELVKLQCMKARMALAFLLGSDATLGQANSLGLQKAKLACLAIEPPEVEQLTEVLGHALYRRSKPHPGGYSATTFSVKYILWSIQCLLLSQPKNQEQFAEAGMERINALLIKILALHALQGVSFVDSEAAGYACTSLYLLSHFGFHACFLPRSIGKGYRVRGLVSKILVALHDANGTSQTTQYMVRQLVRRIPYLLCTDTAAIQKQAGLRENGSDVDGRGDSTDSSGNGGAIRIHVDYTLDSPLIAAALQVVVVDELTGAVPRTDIFNRSVQRRKPAPPRRHAGTKILREIYSDDETEVEGAVVHFSSALHAARELVLENVMYGNSDVDEIDMANQIAICCEGDESASITNAAGAPASPPTRDTCHGFTWSWKESTLGSPDSTNTDASRCHSLSLLSLAMNLPNLCGASDSTSP